jgi:hypothetical protein
MHRIRVHERVFLPFKVVPLTAVAHDDRRPWEGHLLRIQEPCKTHRGLAATNPLEGGIQ